MDIAALLQTIAVFALPVLFAITIHEAAHGYAARHFGDPTAHMLGRITLNPAKHIDPLGTIALPLLLLFATSGAFLFGYAKPVPVNAARLRRPKTDMVWVALAGPASNVVQALLWVIFGYLLLALGIHEPFFLEMAKLGCWSIWCCSCSTCCRCRRWMAGASWSGCCRRSRHKRSRASNPLASSSCWCCCSPACWAPTGCAR